MIKMLLMFCGLITDVWIAAYLMKTYRSWYDTPILITAIIIGIIISTPLLISVVDNLVKENNDKNNVS